MDKRKHLLELNKNKIKMLFIRRIHKRDYYRLLHLSMPNFIINIVYSLKYFGTTSDCPYSFNLHFQNFSGKVANMLNKMHYISGHYYYYYRMNNNHRLIMYKMLIISLFTYFQEALERKKQNIYCNLTGGRK